MRGQHGCEFRGPLRALCNGWNVVDSKFQRWEPDPEAPGYVIKEPRPSSWNDGLLLEPPVGLGGDAKLLYKALGGEAAASPQIGHAPEMRPAPIHQPARSDAQSVGQRLDALGVGHLAPVLVSENLSFGGPDHHCELFGCQPPSNSVLTDVVGTQAGERCRIEVSQPPSHRLSSPCADDVQMGAV
ncbi:hypothetical protein SMALB_2231 [Streptomyces malaysiensis]|uniref:Uncharacterized protein n=1 Tax=Streptomyces malaysiensis TaxID=92644 RepID=A0A7X5X097_STRMQ|nr:hypothetical protein [Streptomyces malaysiensis]